MYRDLETGAHLEPSELDSESWDRLVSRVNQLGREVEDAMGARLVFHPHADSHVETQEQVERFLNDTDAKDVGLCLDTGHIAYKHGSNVELIETFPDRIEYVHFKQIDPAILSVVEERDLAFASAVDLGVTCEPPNGVPTVESLADPFAKLPSDVCVIVEQDMFPCEPDKPLPIATRTCRYLRSAGIGQEGPDV
jgi:inosose dehydratase